MKWQGPIAGMLALVGFAGTSVAQETAYIVTRAGTGQEAAPRPVFIPLEPDRTAAGIYVSPVQVPEATVPEPVSETPALPHLIRLKLAGTYILIDPDEDYLTRPIGGIDPNHSIIQAQQLWRDLNESRAYIVRRPVMPGDAERRSVDDIRPSAVILKPNLLDKPRKDDVDNMPMIPAPQPTEGRQMARAE